MKTKNKTLIIDILLFILFLYCLISIFIFQPANGQDVKKYKINRKIETGIITTSIVGSAHYAFNNNIPASSACFAVGMFTALIKIKNVTYTPSGITYSIRICKSKQRKYINGKCNLYPEFKKIKK